MKADMGNDCFQKLHGKLAMLTLLIAWERQYFFFFYTYLGDIFCTQIHLSENWRLPLRRFFFFFYLKVYSAPLPKLKIPNFYHI